MARTPRQHARGTISTRLGACRPWQKVTWSTARQYNIRAILGQYHSALEHTFLWVVEADDPHGIQEFCVATGLATINELKIVPLITFQEGVIPGLKKIHAL